MYRPTCFIYPLWLVHTHIPARVRKGVQPERSKRMQKGRSWLSREGGSAVQTFLGSEPWVPGGLHPDLWMAGMLLPGDGRKSHHLPPPTPSISTTWRVSPFVRYLKTDMTRCCLETRHLKRGERCWGAAGHAGQELYSRAECQGRGFFPWSSRRTLSSLNLSNNQAYFSLFQCLWRKHWRARWLGGFRAVR